MLNNNQKKQLRGLASTLDTKYQVGKNGLSETLYDVLDKALTAKELIKIDIMKSVDTPLDELGNDLCLKLKAELIQIIGRTIVIFRINKDNNKIKLVK